MPSQQNARTRGDVRSLSLLEADGNRQVTKMKCNVAL